MSSRHVPGSKAAFTGKQLDDIFFTTDWFPNEHPAMPPVVASGRKPEVWACTYCHLPSGAGGPAEAALPGLPEGYIVEQLREFRAGRRKPAQSEMESPQGMEREALALSDAEISIVAKYFSQLPFKSHFHVVEADTAPKTVVRGVSLYAKIPGNGTEPLGKRIVEVPDDFDELELGDPHADYHRLCPKGSIKRGAALVASGDGAAPCSTCHGLDFKGIGMLPPLAGRSASYIVRQLYDIQYGTRRGPAVALMQPEVAHMTADDRHRDRRLSRVASIKRYFSASSICFTSPACGAVRRERQIFVERFDGAGRYAVFSVDDLRLPEEERAFDEIGIRLGRIELDCLVAS